MRNAYESAEILNVDKAQDMILGNKPPADIDAVLGPCYYHLEVGDFDESDE